MSHGHSHEGEGHAHSHGGNNLAKPLLDEEHGHGHGHDGEKEGHGGHGDAHGHAHGHTGGHAHGHVGGHGTARGSPSGCSHAHGGARESDDKGKMKKAIYCALFFMMVEIVGGIVANSLAIVTDAAHMLSDVGGFIVSLLALQLAEMEATEEYSYGFKQAEVLGALVSVMIVWALTAVLMYAAVSRLLNLEEVDAPKMLVIAVIGFVVNLVLMKVLGHGHSHDGGHGHSHGAHGEEETGAAVQAAIAHVIGDIVQSLGVCLAAFCIWTQPFDLGTTESGISKWNYADPCCTLLFGVLVIFTTKSTIVRTVSTLMGKAPKHISQSELVGALGSIPKVDSVHDLHVWSLGSKEVLCTAHVLVEGAEHATSVLKACLGVAQRMGIGHSTFQIEILGEFDPALESYGNLHGNPSRPEILDGFCDGGHNHDDGHGPNGSVHGHNGGNGRDGHSHGH